MSRRTRALGPIAHRTTGRARYYRDGWQQFYATGATVVQEDPNTYKDTVVETTGNTVFTFADSISATGATKVHPAQGWVAAMPLTGPDGTAITLGKPFALRTMIEMISISGDYSRTDNDDKNWPVISMGIGTNATDYTGTAVVADANRHVFAGYRIRATGSQDIETNAYMIYSYLSGTGSGHTTATGSTTNQTGYPLMVTDYMIGPDMSDGSGGAESINGLINICTFADSNAGTPYEKGPTISQKGLSADRGFNADSQVFLYVSIADQDAGANDGSNTAVTLTCRFWYMLTHDMSNGWGGTGSA